MRGCSVFVPVLDVLTRYVPLPIWAAGTAALLLFCALVVVRRGAGRVLGVLFGGACFVLAAGTLTWLSLDWSAVRERRAERRALDLRMTELTAHAIASGSALGCLDAMAGDTVETACEKAVFASPQAVAAAVSYVAARLAFLSDGVDHVRGGGTSYEAALAPSRLALETDRFGIVAHILSVRDSCTALQCDSLGLLHDPTRVQANLRERTFDGYVARHAVDWTAVGAPTPTADAAGAPGLASTGSVPATDPGPATGPVPAHGAPVSSRYDFPSAASIPPVSIMNPEPGSPPAAAAPAAAATTPVPPRRPAQGRGAPARAVDNAARSPAGRAPVPLAPPADGTGGR